MGIFGAGTVSVHLFILGYIVHGPRVKEGAAAGSGNGWSHSVHRQGAVMNTCVHLPSSLSWTSAHGVVPPTSKESLQTSANLYGIRSPSQMHSGIVFDDASESHNLSIKIPYSKDYQFLIGNVCSYSDKVFIPSSPARKHSKFLCFVNL